VRDDDVARLIVACPDRHGIIASLSQYLSAIGANIISSDQYSTDPEGGRFFLRMEFHLDGLGGKYAQVEGGLSAIADPFGMEWRLTRAERRKRVVLFASREDHCLLDLLWRWRRGELAMDVVAVVSNHPDLESEVRPFDVEYHHVPVSPETKPAAEERSLELIAGKVDLIVLARYMQILSAEFLQRAAVPVINIHHSFLPAFVGAKPYDQAHERGVKLIGATAHYATEVLDEGPIIEQDVARVDHADSTDEMTAAGRDVECLVLARAVRWHVEHRVLTNGHKTVVFR